MVVIVNRDIYFAVGKSIDAIAFSILLFEEAGSVWENYVTE